MTVLQLREDERSLLAEPHESDGDDSSSLSLSDLAMITADGPERSPPPPENVEFFFHDCSAAAAAVEMCAADVVFVRGRLIPSNPITLPCHAQASQNPQPSRHRRSESFDALGRQGGGAMAEYRKLRRASSESDPPPAKPRPRWYLFVFGSVRVPAAMEMKDIRARQSRRRQPALTEMDGAGGSACEAGRCGRPWRLIRSLSCKAAESAVATAAPVGIGSHVRGA